MKWKLEAEIEGDTVQEVLEALANVPANFDSDTDVFWSLKSLTLRREDHKNIAFGFHRTET